MRRTGSLLALALFTSAASAQAPTVQLPVGPDTTTALPLRSVREVAALAPAFRRDLATGTLVFRSRTGDVGGVQEPVFVVDGVRRLGGPMGASTTSLLGATVAPFGAVERVFAFGDFAPASIGEAGGGIVAVTTEADTERFGGRVEGLSSEATDAYGFGLASATVRAPFGRFGGVSVTGEAARRGDAVPSAGRSLRLSDEAAALLQTSPQSVLVTDPTGATRAVPFPADAALAAFAAGRPFTQTDLIAALGLAPGSQVGAVQSALGAAALADAERVRAQDDPLRDLALSGQALFFLPAQGRLRLGGHVGRREMTATAPTPAEAFGLRFANRGGLYEQTSDRAGAFAAVERLALPGGVEAGLRASVETTGSVLNPAAFLSAIEDALLYGDIDGAAGEVAQRYVTLAGTRYLQQYGFDSGARPSSRPRGGFAEPGAQASLYDRQSASSTQLAATLARTVGANRIEVGGEVEVQAFRRVTLDGYRLAAFAADADGGQPVGTAFPNGVTRYDQLDFDTLRRSVVRYGYSFNGLDRTDSEDVDGYFGDANGRRSDTDLAPFRPLTAAGYIRDVVRIGPAEIDAGLRVERYDARAVTPFDPYAPTPILRAGDVSGVPTGIGDDFAVYQSGGQTVGYRDRDGQFYDAAGNTASIDDILRDRRGSVISTPDAPRSDAYVRTEASVRLQPRVQVVVQATPAVAVSGYAARLSRRPDPSLYVPFSAYEELNGGTILSGSAALTPEDVRAAGVGVDVQATPLLMVGVHGFARQTRGLPVQRVFLAGFPSYVGVTGDGRRDEAGVDVTARLARTRGVTVAAGYTLAFATDLDVPQAGSSFGPVVLGSSPSAGDTRHALDLALDARVPAGRLRGLGAGVVVAAQSGRPYTALLPNTGFSVFDPFTANVSGTLNGARLPWTSQVDLRLDYRFGAGPATVTAFVWAENVLGTRNVLAVYRSTGQPDADGFAATAAGQSVLTAAGDRLLYEAYTGGPANVGGVQSTDAPFVYGQPRQVRVGLVLGR